MAIFFGIAGMILCSFHLKMCNKLLFLEKMCGGLMKFSLLCNRKFIKQILFNN